MQLEQTPFDVLAIKAIRLKAFFPEANGASLTDDNAEISNQSTLNLVKMANPVSARYIVDDVDAAIEFYTKMLDFKVEMHPAPEFAIVSRDNFKLYLTKPSSKGGGGQPMPDGAMQSAGGWNRISIEVDDLDSMVEKLKEGHCKFRNEVVQGVGGKQILVLDPSGNLVELFQYFQERKPKSSAT